MNVKIEKFVTRQLRNLFVQSTNERLNKQTNKQKSNQLEWIDNSTSHAHDSKAVTKNIGKFYSFPTQFLWMSSFSLHTQKNFLIVSNSCVNDEKL